MTGALSSALAEQIARRTGGSIQSDTHRDRSASYTVERVISPGSEAGRYAVVDLVGKVGAIAEIEQTLELDGWHHHFKTAIKPGRSLTRRRTSVVDREPPPTKGMAPPGYRVLALMTTFNEADIIEGILDRAADEGLSVHLIDNWSTDGTLELAAKHRAVVATERFPDGPARHYEWERLLHRVEEVAAAANSEWVIHHDADEWRMAPWPGVPMSDALFWVAGQGYNAIDHTVIVHPPTDNSFLPGDDVTAALRHFEFGRRPGHFTQIKAWRGGTGVDLASTGGHEARFPGRMLFPFNFLLRHYPIRSQSHGMRKVLEERQPRWSPAERAWGWHNQYEGVRPDHRFLRDDSELELFDEASFYQRHMYQRLARIGIEVERP